MGKAEDKDLVVHPVARTAPISRFFSSDWFENISSEQKVHLKQKEAQRAVGSFFPGGNPPGWPAANTFVIASQDRPFEIKLVDDKNKKNSRRVIRETKQYLENNPDMKAIAESLYSVEIGKKPNKKGKFEWKVKARYGDNKKVASGASSSKKKAKQQADQVFQTHVVNVAARELYKPLTGIVSTSKGSRVEVRMALDFDEQGKIVYQVNWKENPDDFEHVIQAASPAKAWRKALEFIA
jgi:hypothetical protein